MTLGPGKYDAECTRVRTHLRADGVLLIVFGGERGSGFSAQLPLHTTLAVAEILEDVARQIRQDGPLAP